jgi:uncharacterized protein
MTIPWRKLWLLLLVFCLAPSVSRAQERTQTAEGTNGPSAADPAKEADIRRLLNMTAAPAMAEMMSGMMENMRELMTNALPPGDYRPRLVDLFLEKFRTKIDTKQLLDAAVPVYDKYLSREDVNGLIQFYGTPLGQKALSALPKIVIETQAEGAKLGERMGRQSMAEVISEHPELAAALEAAVKQSQNPR